MHFVLVFGFFMTMNKVVHSLEAKESRSPPPEDHCSGQLSHEVFVSHNVSINGTNLIIAGVQLSVVDRIAILPEAHISWKSNATLNLTEVPKNCVSAPTPINNENETSEIVCKLEIPLTPKRSLFVAKLAFASANKNISEIDNYLQLQELINLNVSSLSALYCAEEGRLPFYILCLVILVICFISAACFLILWHPRTISTVYSC